MSNHDNRRRNEEKRTEHGPRWETRECDAPSVAHARKKWKRRTARVERRTGGTSNGGHYGRRKPNHVNDRHLVRYQSEGK